MLTQAQRARNPIAQVSGLGWIIADNQSPEGARFNAITINPPVARPMNSSRQVVCLR